MKKYFIAGLLVWVPVAITIWVLRLVVVTLDESLPEQFRSEALFGVSFPGAGALITLTVVFTTGVLVTNYFGQALVRLGERVLARIPFVRSIYSGVKQVSDTLLAPDGQAFRRAVLVQYPRLGCWTVAFVTGKPSGEVARLLPEDNVSIYVPTTPNPTSGFLIVLRRDELIELDMSVDEALKYVVSMGVIAPSSAAKS
jgi:uncharacterized membrane protein